MQINNTAVLFHFYEVDNTYRDNLYWFLLLGYRLDVDFYIIINDNSSLNLPIVKNIIYIHRNNTGYDYGGYSDFFKNYDYKKYDKIIFLNSSVRGPILPVYAENWIDSFTKLLKDDIGITGVSINILDDKGQEGYLYSKYYNKQAPFCHVQTNAFALSKRSLDILNEYNFWNNPNIKTKIDTVLHFEIRLSQLLLSYSLNLKCMLAPYNKLDFRTQVKEINRYSANGDVRYTNSYFGHSIDPYQIMFCTTNRKIHDHTYLDNICLEQLEQLNNFDHIKNSAIVKWLTQKYVKSNLF